MVKLEKVVVYLTIIPWIFYFSINVFQTLINIENKKKPSLFRFDSIILIFIFVYFVYFNKVFVIQMLFSTINLYFFINSLYEKNINRKNIKKVIMNNKLLLFLLYLFTGIFILILSNVAKLSYFYYSLFALSFLTNVIIYELKRLKIFK